MQNLLYKFFILLKDSMELLISAFIAFKAYIFFVSILFKLIKRSKSFCLLSISSSLYLKFGNKNSLFISINSLHKVSGFDVMHFTFFIDFAHFSCNFVFLQ